MTTEVEQFAPHDMSWQQQLRLRVGKVLRQSLDALSGRLPWVLASWRPEKPVRIQSDSQPHEAAANSLLLAEPGKTLTVVAIQGGDAIRRRLHELGLIPGIEFRLLQSSGGPLLLAVRDSRLAIGRATAAAICVQHVESKE